MISAQIPTAAACPKCGEMMLRSGTVSTLVGYQSPPGHNHDDNCQSRIYRCPNGHEMVVQRQNSCPACDWRGKLTCFCHKGPKSSQWPEEAP